MHVTTPREADVAERERTAASRAAATAISCFDYDALDDGTLVIGIVSVADIAEIRNPLENPPWDGIFTPISVAEVVAAIATCNLVHDVVGPGTFLHDATTRMPHEEACAKARRQHVGRIAAMVVEPPDDHISIEVGIPHLGYFVARGIEITDGNHRLAAAIVRWSLDPSLAHTIETAFDGSYDAFAELFPAASVRVEPDHWNQTTPSM